MTKAAEVAKKDRQIARLKTHNQELLEDIEEKAVEVAKKDARIAQLEAVNQQLLKNVNAMAAKLKQLPRYTELQEEVGRHKKEIAHLKQEIAEKDVQLEFRDNWITVLDEFINTSTETLGQIGVPQTEESSNHEADSRDENKKVVAPAGLKNLGHTCFMNSILQTLTQLRPLRRFMKSDGFTEAVSQNEDNEDGSGGEVARQFQTLIREVEAAKTAVNPQKLKSVIDRFLPDFSDGNPHDAFEFLLQFFDILHEDLRSSADDDRSIISELFQSEIWADRRFRCGEVDTSDDQPSYVILPLPAGKSPIAFDSCISKWTRIEDYDEANPLWCSKCHCLEAFKMQIRVQKLSRYVVVQLLRFKHGENGTRKDKRFVDYPLEFDSTLFRPEQPTGVYCLMSVICHVGGTRSGHYTCVFRQSRDSPWFSSSDTSVLKRNSGKWRRSDAYILFYERMKSKS
jgi:ubiquitin C-terminal hydrolase